MYHFPPHLKYVAALPWNLKVQICRKSGRKFKQKMPHKPVKFPQLSEEKSHEQSLNLPSLLSCRLMKKRSNS